MGKAWTFVIRSNHRYFPSIGYPSPSSLTQEVPHLPALQEQNYRADVGDIFLVGQGMSQWAAVHVLGAVPATLQACHSGHRHLSRLKTWAVWSGITQTDLHLKVQ